MTHQELITSIIILMVAITGQVFYIGYLLHKNSLLDVQLDEKNNRIKYLSESIKLIREILEEKK
jgi:hypothetical protein